VLVTTNESFKSQNLEIKQTLAIQSTRATRPPPNPPIDTTQWWKETRLTIQDR